MGGRPAIEGTRIEGVLLRELELHEDPRGAFQEIHRAEWFPNAPAMVQANLSLSRAGVLRGLHFHRRQADYWCVLSGTAFIALFDLRAGSPTEGRKSELAIDAGNGRCGLYIPPGVAHGFYAVTDMELLYLVDAYFTGEDELGVAWDDPAVGIAWPSQAPVLSDRDRRNPALDSVRAEAPPFGG
jgi:dTDP-4-dehydrorhamnose 3,5-epimerase